MKASHFLFVPVTHKGQKTGACVDAAPTQPIEKIRLMYINNCYKL